MEEGNTAIADAVAPDAADVSGEEIVAEQSEQETVETEDTESESTEQETAEQDDGEQDAEGDETAEESGRKQTTANERVREALEKAKKAEEKAEQIEREFKERLEAEKAQEKPFVELDMAKINSKLQDLADEAAALKLDGDVYEAMKKQREIDALIDKVEANNKAREEWETGQQETLKTKEQQEKLLKDLDKAALTFREANKIPEELFAKQGEFFRNAMENDPILQQEFEELISGGRYMTAIKFAHDHVTKTMGQNTVAEKEKREQAKATSVGKGESVDTQDDAVNKKIKAMRKEVFGNGRPKTEDVAKFLAERRKLRSK